MPADTHATVSAQAAGPLAGVRVLDWTHMLSGPYASYQLALLGADVVRIERADGDDLMRSLALDPALGALGLGEGFVVQNAGKRSLAIDARDADARQALHALLKNADVLVENFRAGKLAALGFAPEDLVAAYPQLIVCSITGFGSGDDTRAPRRAYDHVVQAASGMMDANADADGVPRRIGFPVVDYAVGLHASLGIVAALHRRNADALRGAERTRGEWLRASMMDSALTLLAPIYAPVLVSGRTRPRCAATAFSGSPLSGSFETAEGLLALVCNSMTQAQALLAALAEAGCDRALLVALKQAALQRDVPATHAALRTALQGRTAAEWEERLSRHGVPASSVQTLEAAAIGAASGWPQVELTGAAQRSVHVPGSGLQSNLPWAPAQLREPPRRGAQTRELLAEAGLSAAAIDALIARGAAWEPPPAD